ncbi:MAG: BON domain-containing protein [Acidobacteriaceae bacterium]
MPFTTRNAIRTLQAGTLAFALVFAAGCKQPQPQPAEQAQQPAAPDDATIANSIQSKIAGDSGLANEPIQVAVSNGVATLSGTVSNAAAKALASDDAASITGVKQVLNNLDVKPAETAAAKPAPAPERPRERARKQTRTEMASSAPVAEPAPMPMPASAPAPIVRNTPAPPPAPAKPVVKTVTIPAGSMIPVRITETLDSATTQSGTAFHGVIASDITANGMLAIPAGTSVIGRVVDVKDAAHFKGSSLLSIELASVSPYGKRIAVVTDPYNKEGKGRGKNTAEKVGAGAAIGAILGGILGGGKGAAIGAATGGGLGAGANAVTKGEQVQIPSESLIRFRLSTPVTVTTSTGAGGVKVYDSGNGEPALQQRNP